MQEDFIFNAIYKIWQNTSLVNQSDRVCLNHDDINTSANKFRSTRLQFAQQFFNFFFIHRDINTFSGI